MVFLDQLGVNSLLWGLVVGLTIQQGDLCLNTPEGAGFCTQGPATRNCGSFQNWIKPTGPVLLGGRGGVRVTLYKKTKTV